jgi:hypothetical protein
MSCIDFFSTLGKSGCLPCKILILPIAKPNPLKRKLYSGVRVATLALLV